jgi:hypothetical protein
MTIRTPEFLVWALERRCELRQIAGFEDPERTERHLRTLRAYSEADVEGRVFEGICVESRVSTTSDEAAKGFRVDDALSLYGGVKNARNTCFRCPANLPLAGWPSNLAGCFGMLPLPQDESLIHSAIERAIDELGLRREIAFLLTETQPAWYGLWMHSPLESRRAMLVKGILMASFGECARVSSHWSPERGGYTELVMALESAHGDNLPLHVRLYPRGAVSGAWWNLVPHCQNCDAPWPEAEREQCQVCGYVGHPASPPKRRARGTRPYWPLERMMGKEKAAEFLQRYEAKRTKNSER